MSYYTSLTFKIISFVAGLLVIALVDLPGTTFYWREIQNTGHTLAFGLLAILMMWIIKDIKRFKNHSTIILYLVVIVICIVLGGAIELFQAFMGRDADLKDMLRNIAGIISFLGFSYGLRFGFLNGFENNNKRVAIGIITASVIVLFIGFLPMINLSLAYIKRNDCFPVILNFNNGCGSDFFSLQHARLNVIDTPTELISDLGEQVAEVVLIKGYRFPGIEFKEPEPDWSNYSSLYFKISSNEIAPFKLVLRIHDKKHNFKFNDRFNKVFTIEPGVNLIQISLKDIETSPVDRKMDMRSVNTLIWFAVDPAENLEFYFSKVWLE